ncbi:MAG TPA: triose-phosphate isomerase [Alphaproteobacteria bacterium]|nr:triose-phosphate isomerase [Alphaproteobacteria bacterium]
MARRALIAGNWKMNGLGPGGAGLDGLALARDLLARLRQGPAPRADLVVAPPATLIARVAQILAGSSIAVGGQDCHAEPSGAHTGDLSAEMLKEAGCRYVIVGHSERRADHGEGNAIVRAKTAAAHRAGLIAILCVGEREGARLSGTAAAVVGRQLAQSLPKSASAANTVVAYEPVWAIGSGRTPSGSDIAAMHGLIRRALAGRAANGEEMRILYGGSVKAQNAREILRASDVDGALVGGASLDADAFWAIAQSIP